MSERRVLPATVKAYKVRIEGIGEVVYVDTYIGGDVIRAYLWKCPYCAATFKSLSLRQLAVNVDAHKKKHVDVEWGEGGEGGKKEGKGGRGTVLST